MPKHWKTGKAKAALLRQTKLDKEETSPRPEPDIEGPVPSENYIRA
jgi:hypothetical protein